MMLFLFGFWVAAFLISRLALRLMRNWDGGMARLLAAHTVALALCWGFFAFGSADGRVYFGAGAVTLLPVGFWFVVDYLRGKSALEG